MKRAAPEAACALIPRLEMIRDFGSDVDPLFQRYAERLHIALDDSSAVIEWYLITYWYRSWKDRWLAGVLSDEPLFPTSPDNSTPRDLVPDPLIAEARALFDERMRRERPNEPLVPDGSSFDRAIVLEGARFRIRRYIHTRVSQRTLPRLQTSEVSYQRTCRRIIRRNRFHHRRWQKQNTLLCAFQTLMRLNPCTAGRRDDEFTTHLRSPAAQG